MQPPKASAIDLYIPWRWGFLALVGLAIAFAPLPGLNPASVDRTFHIEASQFSYAPAVLKANPGDRVTIELASNDVVHGLSIDGYAVEMTADPGQPQKATFVASKSGSYSFRCTTTCGNLHPFMVGKLEVGRNVLLWRVAGLAVLAAVAGMWSLRK